MKSSFILFFSWNILFLSQKSEGRIELFMPHRILGFHLNYFLFTANGYKQFSKPSLWRGNWRQKVSLINFCPEGLQFHWTLLMNFDDLRSSLVVGVSGFYTSNMRILTKTIDSRCFFCLPKSSENLNKNCMLNVFFKYSLLVGNLTH